MFCNFNWPSHLSASGLSLVVADTSVYVSVGQISETEDGEMKNSEKK